MFGTLTHRLRAAFRQTHVLSANWIQNSQTRACAARSATFHLHEDHLVLNYGGSGMHFNYVWLRDHCRSESSYNSVTNQRNLDTASIDLNIRPDKTSVEDGNLILTLQWWLLTRDLYVSDKERMENVSMQTLVHPHHGYSEDSKNKATGLCKVGKLFCLSSKKFYQFRIAGPDGHVTKYSLSWLAENSYEARKQKPVQPRILWNADIYTKANVPAAKWDKFMSCDEELKMFLQNYLLYGFAFVEGVPATVEATEAVTQRVSIIRETTYGRMWSFTADFSRGDTAYSTIALDRHIDTTYFYEPCGIQVFHCIKHAATGGKTLLVDGFHAAKKVQQRSPENFELLSRLPIPHEYIENTGSHRNHMIGIGPLINTYPWNKEMYLIRYNNLDRTVINTIPHDLVQKWYVAHRDLTTELRRPENELWVKLTPGKVIFIDNWRVMHGRESFTGVRQLCGCYMTRDDVLSAARSFGLQA